MDPKAKQLIEYIATNLEAERWDGISPLPHGPVWHIEVTNLLAEIERIYSATPEQVGEIVNPIRKRIKDEQEVLVSKRLFG